MSSNIVGDLRPQYKLHQFSHKSHKALPNHHECSPSSINGLIKKFSDCLYSAVKNDPTKPIPRIYEECREQISDGLCDDEKLVLFREIPNFRNIQSGLYKHRLQFIPQEPHSFSEFDIHSNWVTQGDIIVKSLFDGRILVFLPLHL